jgi:hypothetical protein
MESVDLSLSPVTPMTEEESTNKNEKNYRNSCGNHKIPSMNTAKKINLIMKAKTLLSYFV